MAHSNSSEKSGSQGSSGGKMKGGLTRVGTAMASGYTVPMDKLIKYAGILTIVLGVLAYLIHAVAIIGTYPNAWQTEMWYLLILPIAGGILYMIFVQKSLQTNVIDKKTYIFLIASTGLACAALLWPGVPLLILFVETCVGSNTPYWTVLTESHTGTTSKAKSVPQSKTTMSSQPTAPSSSQPKTTTRTQPTASTSSQPTASTGSDSRYQARKRYQSQTRSQTRSDSEE